MKFATMARSPVFGGKVGKVDDSAAKKIPGVQQIIVLDDLVAVVGDHMWAAKTGLDALVVSWDDGRTRMSIPMRSGPDCVPQVRSLAWSPRVSATSQKGLGAGDKIEASYEMPFLAHATMEPMNCTVHLKPDSCEIWIGTQIMTRVQSEARKPPVCPLRRSPSTTI